MDDVVVVNMRFEYREDGRLVHEYVFDNITYDVADALFVHHRQSIGTSLERLDAGGLLTETDGWLFAKNHDDTNFVELSADSVTPDPSIKLKPGEFMLARLSASALRISAIADTAACDVEYLWIQNTGSTPSGGIGGGPGGGGSDAEL